MTVDPGVPAFGIQVKVHLFFSSSPSACSCANITLWQYQNVWWVDMFIYSPSVVLFGSVLLHEFGTASARGTWAGRPARSSIWPLRAGV